MRFTKIFFLCGLLMAASGQATVRYVSPSGTAPYQTFAAANGASANGDTILIGPGYYPEDINWIGVRTIIGAGWDRTQAWQLQITQASTTGSVIEGIFFSIPGQSLNVGSNADSVLIRRCRFLSSSNYVCIILGNRITLEDCLIIQTGIFSMVSVPTDRLVVRNCLFVHQNGNNSSRYAFIGNNGNLEIYNCVFLGLLRILNCTGSQPVVFVNNIVYDWAGAGPVYGTYLAGSMFDYNASSVITPPGTNAILLTADPFVNYDEAANWVQGTSDLHPAAGAPIIDSGHPDITDLDSTQSDMGIYGGPRPLVDYGVPSYPFALTLTISPTLIGVGDTVQVNTSGRVGPRY